MQPTFLPWAGYFNLMAEAEVFVLLDDVQVEKQSWQTRNRLWLSGAVRWVSVPIRHARLDQTIAETEIRDETRWREKLGRGIRQSYGKHPFADDALELVAVIEDSPATRLAALNEAIIRHVAARLTLGAAIHRASDLGVAGRRSDRLIALCRHFSAREYLSPPGSAAYLEEDGFAARSPARLRFQSYTPAPYPQKGPAAFESHLSILDVVAHLGWMETRRYVTG